jgi:hypothetical protein
VKATLEWGQSRTHSLKNDFPLWLTGTALRKLRHYP